MYARRFVRSVGYKDLCRQIDRDVALLMGHTRWPTQGSYLCNDNNQPLVSDEPNRLALTHNGNIPDVACYFSLFDLERKWEVDSELLLRLARRHILADGLAIPHLIDDLSLCAGQIAAVVATASRPDEVVFVRRDRPLWVAYDEASDLLAYASEPGILLQALPDRRRWTLLDIPEDTVWHVHRQRLAKPDVYQM